MEDGGWSGLEWLLGLVVARLCPRCWLWLWLSWCSLRFSPVQREVEILMFLSAIVMMKNRRSSELGQCWVAYKLLMGCLCTGNS